MHGMDLKNGWFDCYSGQSVLILDDWKPSCCDIGTLLKLLDIYKCRVKKKNGFTFGVWNYVIITTNVEWPGMVYTNALQESRQALFRRVDKVVHMDKPWGSMTPVYWEDSESEDEGPDQWDEERKEREATPMQVEQEAQEPGGEGFGEYMNFDEEDFNDMQGDAFEFN